MRKNSYFEGKSNGLKLFRLLSGMVVGLCVLMASLSLWGHGELGEEAKHFEEYVAEFKKEVANLTANVDGVVRAYKAGDDVTEEVEGLIKRWKEVGVHGAIEVHATPLYPGVWQGLLGLQQAADNEKSATKIALEGEKLKAALWQGLGAVRLAASQVKQQDQQAAHETHEGDGHQGEENHEEPSPEQAINQITDALDEAVAVFKEGDAETAKSIIHKTYMEIFEGLEGDLIEMRPELVTQLEKDFNAGLPLLMDETGSLEKVRSKVQEMHKRLETAKKLLLKAEQARSKVFGQ